MRLIDADKISNYIKNEINPYGNPFEGNAYEFGLKIMRYIDAMDSDYDLDKVVEELKTDSSIKLYGSQNSDNYLIPVNKVIEIVKQGGVADDVCEWNGEQSRLVTFTMFTTDCGDNIDLQTNSELLKAFRYCPFCGKKIKVVE